MSATYQVLLDRDDDGDFAGAGEDLTAAVLAIHWQRGLAQPHDTLAQPGRAQITLRNLDQTYSPEINPLTPGQVLRITSDDGTTLRTHFTGHVTHIEPQTGSQGQRQVVIHAVDALAQLGQHTIRLPPQVDVRAGEVIEQILDAVPFRRMRLQGYWLVGRVDHGELGSNTRLAGETIPRSLDAGQTILAYVGDTWADGLPAAAAMQQVLAAERGRFYVDHTGQAVFYDRHHLLKATISLAAFTDDMSGLDYAYGHETISRVLVRVWPRSIGTAHSPLWQITDPLRLRAGETVQMVARYHDAAGLPVGALDVIPPVRALDFTAKALTGDTDLTEWVDVLLRRADFSAAVLELRNRWINDVLVLPLRLRGTPLAGGNPLLLEQISYGSLAFHTGQALWFDLPALTDLNVANSLAQYELARRKTPRGQVRQMTLSGPQHLAQMLIRRLFERITITEGQTGQSADYFIVAEDHTVDLGGYRHQLTWTLENADARTFWVLGQARLNQTSVLAY